jgi:hypothetical protein
LNGQEIAPDLNDYRRHRLCARADALGLATQAFGEIGRDRRVVESAVPGLGKVSAHWSHPRG